MKSPGYPCDRLCLVCCVVLSAALVLAQERGVSLAATISVQRKTALVIGNGAYPATPLRNPPNDVSAVADSLRRLGFEVTAANDLTRRQIDEATSRFTGQLRAGDLALFYYSGHGVQLNQENYLIPVDFQGASASDIRYNAFPVAQIRDRMEESRARVRILILDACRVNPYRGERGIVGGLAAMNSTVEGTLIAYATADNSVAEDNAAEGNGLYTKHLLRALSTPGLSLKQVFELTRDEVWLQGGRRQRPYTYDGIVGDMPLTGGGRPGESATVSVPTTPAPDPEMVAWQAVENSNSLAALQQFLTEFPSGRYAAAARVKLAALRPAAPAVEGPAAPATRPAVRPEVPAATAKVYMFDLTQSLWQYKYASSAYGVEFQRNGSCWAFWVKQLRANGSLPKGVDAAKACTWESTADRLVVTAKGCPFGDSREGVFKWVFAPVDDRHIRVVKKCNSAVKNQDCTLSGDETQGELWDRIN